MWFCEVLWGFAICWVCCGYYLGVRDRVSLRSPRWSDVCNSLWPASQGQRISDVSHQGSETSCWVLPGNQGWDRWDLSPLSGLGREIRALQITLHIQLGAEGLQERPGSQVRRELDPQRRTQRSDQRDGDKEGNRLPLTRASEIQFSTQKKMQNWF